MKLTAAITHEDPWYVARCLEVEVASQGQSVEFASLSQRGSHVKLRNDGGRTAIVPLHRQLAPGTLRSVLRQAGLTVEEFVKLR